MNHQVSSAEFSVQSYINYTVNKYAFIFTECCCFFTEINLINYLYNTALGNLHLL